MKAQRYFEVSFRDGFTYTVFASSMKLAVQRAEEKRNEDSYGEYWATASSVKERCAYILGTPSEAPEVVDATLAF
jgi:hypothetical protein